jgi:ribosomal protein S18 acetylase RimI-like enzyme
MEIKYTENITQEIEAKMSEGLGKYEEQKGVDLNYKKFAFVLSDNSGKIFGGLTGYTAFKEVYIDDLWVDESLRGKGFGKSLLQAVEKHFTGHGFDNMNLVTNGFQAPEFYKKCGFELEFVRENKQDSKFNKYFFIKRF